MRVCNGCTACCHSVAVHEVHKKTNSACPHVGTDCCEIYSDRPDPCKEFGCSWLREMRGFHAESMRPDRCGVLAAGGPTRQGVGMFFYSVWEDAFDEGRIQSIMRMYNSKFPIILVPSEGSSGKLFDKGEALCR